MKRRELLGAAGAAVLLITIVEEESLAVPPPPPGHELPPPREIKIDARVSQNHGHVFAISIADVDAAADRTYDLTGTSGHKHEVTLTKAHFLEIQQAKIVRLASTSFGGHLHRIYARARAHPLPPDEVNVLELFIGGKDDHELIVPQSHLDAGTDRTYDIQANSPHTHSLTIRAADFERIKKGEKITITSSRGAEDNHTHVVFLGTRVAKPKG